jgi:McrBC 5-methylcytosine restriction system component
LHSLFAPGTVHAGGLSGRESRIFEKVADEYTANPDLILTAQTGFVAVGDAKYKVWNASPSNPDLYQLLVHSGTYGASTAFLIFPHDTFISRDLGEPRMMGRRTWLFAVDIRELERDLGGALKLIEPT